MLSLTKGAAVVGLGNLIGAVFSTLFTIFVAQLLDTGQFGEVRYVLGVAGVFSTLVISGFCTSVIYFLARERDDETRQSEYFLGGLVLSLVSTPVLIAGALLVGGFRWVLSVVLIGNLLSSIYSAMLTGLQLPVRLSLFTCLSGVLRVLAILPLFALGFRASSNMVVILFCLAPMIGVLGIEVILRSGMHVRRVPIEWHAIRAIASFSLPIILANAAYVGLSGIDLIVIEHFRGLDAVGIYSATKALPLLFMFVPQAYSTILMPMISSQRLSSTSFRHFLRPIKVTGILSVLFLVALALFGRQLMGALFPARYFASNEILLLLGLAMVFAAMHWLLGAMWVGLGRPIVTAVGSGAGAVVYLPAAVLLVSEYGLLGASAALALGFGVACAVLCVYSVLYFRGDESRLTTVLKEV